MVLMGLSLAFATAQAGSLKAGKAKKDFETQFPAIEGKMKTACGCAPKFEVPWDQMTEPGDELIALRAANHVRDAFVDLCKDDASKKTVCNGVKTVNVKKGPAIEPTLASGTLTMQRTQMEGYAVKHLLETSL
jgi:hypothetical protein